MNNIATSIQNTGQYWSDQEILECVSAVPEGPDTATFSFIAPSGHWFHYEPGQFVTLELHPPQGSIWRTYTLSSTPSRPTTIAVTVKAQKDSIGTRWMLDYLKPGMQLRAKGPSGIFTFPDKDQDRGRYLFISAGSGITPSLSMTKYLFDLGKEPDICFINCAKKPSELIAYKQLVSMASRVPSIKLHMIVEEDDPFAAWTGYRGQINQIMLGLMAPDYLEREVFCCGPEPFMKAVREILTSLGFDMAHYHQESFGAPEAEVATTLEDDHIPSDEHYVNITFTNSNIKTQSRETDTILNIARENGIAIPSGCTFGLCGTCKVKKTKGDVHMVHNGGISEDDVNAGYILACCSQPQNDVEIEI